MTDKKWILFSQRCLPVFSRKVLLCQQVSVMWVGRSLENLAHKPFLKNPIEIRTFLVISYLLQLSKEGGHFPTSLLCAHLLDAIGMIKLILIRPKLTKKNNLYVWRVVADQLRETTETYSEPCQASKMEIFTKICKKLHRRCLTGFWIRVWTIIEYHVILYQKRWNCWLRSLFKHKKLFS